MFYLIMLMIFIGARQQLVSTSCWRHQVAVYTWAEVFFSSFQHLNKYFSEILSSIDCVLNIDKNYV